MAGVFATRVRILKKNGAMKVLPWVNAILVASFLAITVQAASGQLYLLNSDDAGVSKYDSDTGALINPHFITDLTGPKGIAYANGALYIAEMGRSLTAGGFVGKYDAATGAPINSSLVSGLTIPQFVCVVDNDLFVGSFDGSGQAVVGKYDATSGAVVNRFFLSHLPGIDTMAARGNHIYISYEGAQVGVGDYDASTGAPINEHLLPFAPMAMVAGGDFLWVSAWRTDLGNTFKVDASTGINSMGMLYPLVRGVGGSVALSGDDLFIYNPQHGLVMRYNASTGAPINTKFVIRSPGTGGMLAVVPKAPPAGSQIADATTNFFSRSHLLYLAALVYSFPAVGYTWLGFGLVVMVAAAFVIRSLMRRRPDVVVPDTAPEATPQSVPSAIPGGWRLLLFLTAGVFALLIGSAALVYEVALPMYIRQITVVRAATYQQAVNDARAQAAPLPAPTVPKPIPEKTLPPVLEDPNNYGTENNWIAAMIARRLAELTALTRQGGPPPAGLKVHADVQVDPNKVHLEITGLGGPPITADLQPDFAWDPQGYAPLVGLLFGGKAPSAEVPADQPPDEVTTLLSLTNPILAREDVTVSNLLLKHPMWPAVHEQAALLLVGMALRDRAGGYTDSRPALSLATAHLAWAQALRGATPPGWAGAIADAGIRALSGREKDALDHLDALAVRSDCSPADKAWLDALRLRATDNWTLVQPTSSTPLVELIAWSQALNDNLDAAGADRRLQKLGSLPQVADFGHASISNLVQHSVQTDNEYCEAGTQVDVAELSDSLQAEGASPAANATVGEVLAQPLEAHLFSGPSATPRVLGPDLFKDFARRHVLNDLWNTYIWLDQELGVSDQDQGQFRTGALKEFGGMRRLENLYLFEDSLRSFSVPGVLEEVKKNHRTWFPWELADGDLVSTNSAVTDFHPDIDTLHSFYRDGLPFGTVYDVANRPHTLYAATQFHHKPPPSPDGTPQYDTYPWVSTMEALNPDSFAVFHLNIEGGGGDATTAQQEKRWWDYNLPAIEDAEKSSDALPEDQFVQLLQKHAALEPAAWFTLGQHLRNEGKDDEAADADRKGFEQDDDAVGMSNSVGRLVDYYLDHNRMNDAETVAKGAGDTGSAGGLLTYCLVLEKEGRVKEALDAAKDVADRYNVTWRVDDLYAAHPEVFPVEHQALYRKDFPNGMSKVTVDSFNGPPSNGCVITSNSPQLQRAALDTGDVVVGLDGYKVETSPQYDYIRAQSIDPKMDFIVWRQNDYLEVHASVPHRKFFVDMDTYKP
jgi:hypothetical protein